MRTWWLESNDRKKRQIYPRKGIQYYERNIYKNWEYKSVLGFNSSEEIPNFTNHDISESNMRCDICIIELCYDM